MSKNSSKTAEHNSGVIPAVNDSVKVRFYESGTDTSSSPYTWYYDLEFPARVVSVKVDQIAQITHINDVQLKNPINMAANTAWSQTGNPYINLRFVSIQIKVLVVNTNVEVYGSC